MTDITRTAKVSDCGTYRYALTRTWAPASGEALFVMLNPSTADGARDDATIRKLIGFTRQWGLGGFRVANLFAYRATEPRELHLAHKRGVDIVGPQNLEHTLALSHGVGRIVVAWGANAAKHERHAAGMVSALSGFCPSHPLFCFGRSADGHPLHPLTLTYATRLQIFAPSVGATV